MADYYSSYMVDCKFPREAALDFLQIVSAFRNFEITETDPELTEQLDTDFPEWYARKNELLSDGGIPRSRLMQYMEDAQLLGISSMEDMGYQPEDGILFFGSDSLDPSALADILADVMEEHGCEELVEFEVACHCSELIPGNFGGSVYVVGPGMVKTMSTGEMGKALREEMARELSVGREHGPSL